MRRQAKKFQEAKEQEHALMFRKNRERAAANKQNRCPDSLEPINQEEGGGLPPSIVKAARPDHVPDNEERLTTDGTADDMTFEIEASYDDGSEEKNEYKEVDEQTENTELCKKNEYELSSTDQVLAKPVCK